MDKISEKDYWNNRWESKQTGWDVGYATAPISKYFSTYQNKKAAILIPGCGNAHEAAFLIDKGFTNITLIDIAPKAVHLLKEKFDSNHQIKILCEDFFDHQGKYDIIIEQTFFCAIPPSKRNDYVQKVASLLHPNGRLTGVLFNMEFEKQEPPFGGNAEAYQLLFSSYFNVSTLMPCYNSIAARAGSEIFINFTKKQTINL